MLYVQITGADCTLFWGKTVPQQGSPMGILSVLSGPFDSAILPAGVWINEVKKKVRRMADFLYISD